MKIIETLYEFATRMDLQVSWDAEAKNTFTEVVQENSKTVEITCKQDGYRIIMLAKILSLANIANESREKTLKEVLYKNYTAHRFVSYALDNNDVLIARADIVISDAVDDVLTQYVSSRNELIKAVHSPDLLSIAE